MGLFSRKKDVEVITNAINVNDVDVSSICRPFDFNFWQKGKKDFASLFIYVVLERIDNAMRNVTFKTTEPDLLGDEIIRFVDKNLELLLWSYFKNGYICVMSDGKGKYRLPNMNELRFDQYRMITNKNAIVIYSNLYQTERDSHIKVAQPFLQFINENMNNVEYITRSCGLWGIISGKSIPISPASKDELQEKLRRDYNNQDGKFNFILSNAEVNFTPVTIPIKDLEMIEKVNDAMKWICNLFQVNPDLVFGGSTFSNQEEAYKALYRDCIIPLAERMLLLEKAMYIKDSKVLKPSSVMTFDLSNVPELNTSMSEACKEKTAYLNYLLALKDAGADVQSEIDKLAADAYKLLQV